MYDYLQKKVTADQLFQAHRDKAEKMARMLCWKFQISGALAFQEDAIREAQLELWRLCQEFDPGKQAFQNKQAFWSIMLWPDKWKRRDPYAKFWIWAMQSVRGRIIDYFRKERLITRQQGKRTPQRSMLYRDRFLSGSGPVFEGGTHGDISSYDSSAVNSFLDLFPSKDRADGNDDVEHARFQLAQLMSKAKLSHRELMILQLYYGEMGFGKQEIAQHIGETQVLVSAVLKTAILKLRECARV